VRGEVKGDMKRITLVKQEGEKRKGRRRMRQKHAVEKDLKYLGIGKWKTRAREREDWRKFLEKAKAYKEL
jgi:hypothetical protein